VRHANTWSQGRLDPDFRDCNNATVHYDLPSAGRLRVIHIARMVNDNAGMCEDLSSVPRCAGNEDDRQSAGWFAQMIVASPQRASEGPDM
jgi:hypothetical protein